jgi:hypothetical protein
MAMRPRCKSLAQAALWSFASALLVGQSTVATVGENNGPKQATFISDDEVKTILKGAPPAVDQQIKVVDTGKYNVGVGVIHRGKIMARPDGSVAGIAHHNQSDGNVRDRLGDRSTRDRWHDYRWP